MAVLARLRVGVVGVSAAVVEAAEAVDLSDLDLLDAPRHGYCAYCQGDPVPVGVQFTALCGARGVHLYHWPLNSLSFPPDACDECVALYDQPCWMCGLP